MKTIGLALGGGGARGFAHIPILEVIDTAGIRPSAISGTSIGAIIGALYASGKSGAEIRSIIDQFHLTKKTGFRDALRKIGNLIKGMGVVRSEKRRGGLVNVDRFLEFLVEQIGVETFEELKIPFYAVSTDFWSGEEVAISSGKLLPAIKASMSIPGVFSPVELDGRILVDGGLVNNVPYDMLMEQCDTTIAIDIAPLHTPSKHKVPGIVDAGLGMFDMLVEQVMEQKRKQVQADIYVQCRIKDVRVLEFNKIDSCYQQAQSAVEDLKKQLKQKGFEF
ncbi:MAG: patatin-like phospholipase family protein [Verrucomicrobia bacterium]|nr:patatin-like phospholipase family protein [Verrucomicrobiota bacterium]